MCAHGRQGAQQCLQAVPAAPHSPQAALPLACSKAAAPLPLPSRLAHRCLQSSRCCAPRDQDAVAARAACQQGCLGEAVEEDGLGLGDPEGLQGKQAGGWLGALWRPAARGKGRRHRTPRPVATWAAVQTQRGCLQNLKEWLPAAGRGQAKHSAAGGASTLSGESVRLRASSSLEWCSRSRMDLSHLSALVAACSIRSRCSMLRWLPPPPAAASVGRKRGGERQRRWRGEAREGGGCRVHKHDRGALSMQSDARGRRCPFRARRFCKSPPAFSLSAWPVMAACGEPCTANCTPPGRVPGGAKGTCLGAAHPSAAPHCFVSVRCWEQPVSL